MSGHDDHVRLRHMLDHAREAVELVSGLQRHNLTEDRVLSLAVVRLLEIVGEAAARVSPAFRDAHPEAPWRSIVGMRNRLIHGYDDVDFDILWTILRQDLPPLIKTLELILE